MVYLSRRRCSAAAGGCLSTGVVVGFWGKVDGGGGDEGGIRAEYIDGTEHI